MSVPFDETVRALRRDHRRGRVLTLAGCAAILAAVTAWASLAQVPIYVATASARVESTSPVQRVQSSAAARVVSHTLQVGRRVAQGEPLVVLDDRALAIDLTDKEERIRWLEAELSEAEREGARSRDADGAAVDAAAGSLAVGRAQLAEAVAGARVAVTEARNARRLAHTGALAEIEVLKLEADAAAARAKVAAAQAGVTRLVAERRGQQHGGAAAAASTQQHVARLRNELQSLRRQREAAQALAGERIVRATVTGVIGEIQDLAPGSWVAPGERLATIVPDAPLQVVGRVAADRSVGRLRPGQSGVLRLTAYPWIEFGAVPVRVESVATEPPDARTDGTVAVYLSIIDTGDASAVALRHGMAGQLEIAVDHATPLSLVLRSAGL